MQVILLVVGIVCYIANLIQLTAVTVFTGVTVVKAIGILIAPLGALMGFIGLF